MIKVGSLWRHENEDSKVIFRGKVDLPCPILLEKNTSILLFKNTSDHEKSPVLDILIAEDKPQAPAQAETQARSNSDVDF